MNAMNEMNEITIRDLDNASVQSLRRLAWRNGRPVEEIARSLLVEATRAEAARARELPRPDFFPPPTD
jgi:plasmid stability protein